MHRYMFDDNLLWYRAEVDDAYRIVVPNEKDLLLQILFKYHDSATKDIVAVRKHIWQSVGTSTGRNNTDLYEITYKPAKCANA